MCRRPFPGLIPARAGNTIYRLGRSCTPRAHPRSRGEHRNGFVRQQFVAGSSPLARGTHHRLTSLHSLAGLIPARAGNTSRRANPPGLPRAHPRSRGEHAMTSTQMTSLMGSSPLARGTRPALRCAALCRGLIPARAGNTRTSFIWFTISWAHPRSRGEHFAGFRNAFSKSGSSPLARGTHLTATRTLRSPGLIPARAGNTNAFYGMFFWAGAHPRSRGEHSD